MPPDDLPAALAADLTGCFERLVLTYQDRLFAFALRLTGDPRDAEEAAQDGFVRAYRALISYPPDRIATLVLRPWLYRIVLNVIRNRRRVRQPLTTPLARPEDEQQRELPADRGESPEARLLRAERQARLAQHLAGLPLRYRAAVVLRHVEGLSYAEIATALDQPIGTAKANVHRGVRLLRTALTADRDAVEAASAG